jgi:malonyl CoA-acyl carrier protein transacylase
MDFGQAAILTFVFLGLISEAKSLVWGTNKERITVGLVNVVAVITVFLVATSAWADSQIIGDKNLGALGWSSELLVAIVLAGSASGLWQALSTVKNIGVPMPTEAQKAAMDKGAEEYALGHLPDAGGTHPTAEPVKTPFLDPGDMKA